jgi:DNA-binding FadR family transcriptional regulator
LTRLESLCNIRHIELSTAENWKHRKIYEQMYAAISRGEFAPGDRLPTDG